ncbi:ComF family protein [Mizugakiibacter sediminis]|uniref:ComF family protein n=1 Tax=Mizugakiibacter sediminis TaxID=1475481 RepID=UPI0007810A06|nr:ComF family protein [Mizugakiibacter sediminis]
MSIAAVTRPLLRLLLPPRCLLCGARGDGDRDLCAACAAELPRNVACCARCALPLPAPAALCGACQRRPPPWDAAWAPFRYAWPLDHLVTRFKFGGNLAAGRALAALWAEASAPPALPMCVIPVPLHARRLGRRGYNQALELAAPLARALGLPLAPQALRRVRATDAQSELGRAARRRNVRGAFAVAADALPAHVAVLDDVATTGATLAECARALKRAGVARVDAWTLARAAAR